MSTRTNRMKLSAVLVVAVVTCIEASLPSTAHGQVTEQRRAGAVSWIEVTLAPDAVTTQSIENRLGTGATTVMRGVRRGIRQTVKTALAAVVSWGDWLPSLLLFVAVAFIVPLLDRALWRTWRERGWRALGTSMALGLAVYIRLLLDRRAPLIGKGILAASLAYGVSTTDFVPDRFGVLDVVDDLVVVALASRGFTWLCPRRLVEEHALKASRRRSGILRRRAASGRWPSYKPLRTAGARGAEKSSELN